MSSLFSRIPIRLKIILVFSFILFLSATFNFLYYPQIHKKQALEYVEAYLRNTVETVALSAGISLELMDFSSIALAIKWAKKDPNLVYLGIFDEEDAEIGIYNPNKLKLNFPKMLNRKGSFEINGVIYLVAPINYRQNYHGKTIIGLSLGELNAGIHDNKLTTLYISLGILLVGLLISIFISSRITQPLARLTEATQEVGKGNYSIDFNVKSSDEIGILARAFQGMTEKINLTMTENARINKQLEGIIDDLTDTATTLSAEKNFKKLLDIIISKARSLANADAYTLYLVEGDKLVFSIIHNDTLDIQMGGKWGDNIPFPPVDIIESNVSGYAALNKIYLNIPDVYSCDDFDFTGPKAFDKKSGYRSKSMLVMPLLNLENKTVGVFQLINAKDPKTGEIISFPRSVEKLVNSLASQAAVAITNLSLKENTERLLEEVTYIKDYNESILESLSNGVITLDSQNKITKCNSASLRILDIEAGELIGQPIMKCFSPDPCSWPPSTTPSPSETLREEGWLINSIQRVLETRQSETMLEGELRIKNKPPIVANITINPLMDINNELIGTMMIIDDITMEKRIKGTLARFMTKEVAEKLLEGGETLLGGQIQEAAILFSDIRDFTSLAENLSPQKTVEMLNEYFDIMVDLIFNNDGTLDKFIGDSILAVYGVPFKGSHDSENAVRTSLEMIRALKGFNQTRMKDNKPPIHIRIGINTDEVLAGTIGTLRRMEYTIIGDGVNLASRLESANKYFGTKILISQNTFLIVKNKFLCREIDLIKVKGKDIAVSIYEVLDFNDNGDSPRIQKSIETFKEGLSFYRDRKWKKCVKQFNKILSLNPDDRVSQIYIDRSEFMMNHPPDKNWDAIWVMETK